MNKLDYPLKCPDGVVYWSPGTVEYPKEHKYAVISRALEEIAADSSEMCERIEKLVGERFVSLRQTKGWK